jgi:hypothetical protein
LVIVSIVLLVARGAGRLTFLQIVPQGGGALGFLGRAAQLFRRVLHGVFSKIPKSLIDDLARRMPEKTEKTPESPAENGLRAALLFVRAVL